MGKRKTIDSVTVCIGCGTVSLRRHRPEVTPTCKECAQEVHLPEGQDALMAAWLIGGPDAVIPELLKEPELRGALFARVVFKDLIKDG